MLFPEQENHISFIVLEFIKQCMMLYANANAHANTKIPVCYVQ